jgi:hypothetical protein
MTPPTTKQPALTAVGAVQEHPYARQWLPRFLVGDAAANLAALRRLLGHLRGDLKHGEQEEAGTRHRSHCFGGKLTSRTSSVR